MITKLMKKNLMNEPQNVHRTQAIRVDVVQTMGVWEQEGGKLK